MRRALDVFRDLEALALRAFLALIFLWGLLWIAIHAAARIK
jgi:hypothetical protein